MKPGLLDKIIIIIIILSDNTFTFPLLYFPFIFHLLSQLLLNNSILSSL